MALANLYFLCRCCQRCQNSHPLAFSSTIYVWSSARNISHYDVLGIKQDATPKEIKQAFFKKSKQLHPDSNPANPALHSQFVKLNEAYNVLSKEKTRRDYDAWRTTQKSWQAQERRQPWARDPFDDVHIHHPQRNRKTREHSAEDSFHSDHFQARGRNPDSYDDYGDYAYWQEFHKTPPEWYKSHEFKRRQQRNQRIVMYCFLIMSGSLCIHFLSYSQVAKLHTKLMDKRDHMISEAIIKTKEQARVRHEERLRQKSPPILKEDPPSSSSRKPHPEILDSTKDPIPPISTAK